MVLEATSRHGIDRQASWLVGDKHSDVECAVRAGVRAVQVLADERERHGSAIAHVRSLHEALQILR